MSSWFTITVVHGSVLDVLLHDAHYLVADDHQHDGHPGHEEDREADSGHLDVPVSVKVVVGEGDPHLGVVKRHWPGLFSSR